MIRKVVCATFLLIVAGCVSEGVIETHYEYTTFVRPFITPGGDKIVVTKNELATQHNVALTTLNAPFLYPAVGSATMRNDWFVAVYDTLGNLIAERHIDIYSTPTYLTTYAIHAISDSHVIVGPYDSDLDHCPKTNQVVVNFYTQHYTTLPSILHYEPYRSDSDSIAARLQSQLSLNSHVSYSSSKTALTYQAPSLDSTANSYTTYYRHLGSTQPRVICRNLFKGEVTVK